MSANQMEVEEGDIIYYDTFMGTNRRVHVTALDDECGQKVFMGITTDGHEKVWGYLAQITKNLGQPFHEIEK